MSAPTAVLAEDEEVLRGELRARLAALWPELVVVAEAADGLEAARALTEHAPDILVLDIQMPGMSGLEVARVASRKCHVVFVTAYDRYAVAAFEQGAVDYVLKPFSTARLADTVARLKDRLQDRPRSLDGILGLLATGAPAHRKFMRWVMASHGSATSFITVEEVCYFRADNKYTLVIMPDREAVIRRPIKDLAEAIDPELFWQIHRATLVNVNAIAGVTRDFRGQLHVRLKQRKELLPVSEPYVHLFRQM